MSDAEKQDIQGLRPEYVILDEVQRWPQEDSEGRAPDEFWNWVQQGVSRGWVDPPTCDTHEPYRRTLDEQQQWDEGEDPCATVMRVWFPEDAPPYEDDVLSQGQ